MRARTAKRRRAKPVLDQRVEPFLRDIASMIAAELYRDHLRRRVQGKETDEPNLR
jgi:hypothetical protein